MYKILQNVEHSVKGKFSRFLISRPITTACPHFVTRTCAHGRPAAATCTTMCACAPPSSNVQRANEREVARTSRDEIEMSERASFSVEAMVRGCHTYQSIWIGVVGEELPCQWETVNPRDPFAVAVLRDDAIVGHIPRKISSICSLFLRRNGLISCQVTGSRRYSEDLPQGGLEVPCVLTFEGSAKDVERAEKLIRSALKPNDPPASKKRKLTETEQPTKPWVQLDAFALQYTDREAIMNGDKLNDLHINYAQKVLQQQFPGITGLQSTLHQQKLPSQRTASQKKPTDKHVQIIHSRGNHWIVASTIHSARGEVKVYNSVYNSFNTETKAIISNLFRVSHDIQMAKLQKQDGGNDCGLFAIAVSSALASGLDPTKMNFDQERMRSHFVSCFELGTITLFPTN